MRFDHGLTASTANQPVQTQQAQAAPVYQNQAAQNQPYQDPQPYPGDDPSRVGNIDLTTTASIGNTQARKPGLLQRITRLGRPAPTPSADIGAAAAAPRQPLPAPQSAAVQPFPTAPAPISTGQVARQPIGAPAPSANIDRTTTGSIQQLPAPAAPTGAAPKADRLPVNAPLPSAGVGERQAAAQQSERLREPVAPRQEPVRTATTGAVYTVVAGDTLSGIAQKTGSSTSAIKSANGLDSGLIRIGQKLVIPGATIQASAPSALPPGVDPIVTGGVTKPAESPAAPKPQETEIDAVVQDTSAAPDSTGVGRLRWPVHGRVVSAFGSQSDGKRNDGVDIAVPEGTPVKAAENGVVIYAGDGLKDFGNTVLVRHDNGIVTVYGHNSEITVSRGTTVRRGQEIARSGLSGNAGSPKLHFEVRKDSSPVDPVKYLE